MVHRPNEEKRWQSTCAVQGGQSKKDGNQGDGSVQRGMWTWQLLLKERPGVEDFTHVFHYCLYLKDRAFHGLFSRHLTTSGGGGGAAGAGCVYVN